jgi:hypothetical protein
VGRDISGYMGRITFIGLQRGSQKRHRRSRWFERGITLDPKFAVVSEVLLADEVIR